MYYWLLLIFVVDANIAGEELLLLDSSSFKELGYTLKESVRIVGLVKSLVKCFEVRAKYIVYRES